MSHHSGYQNVRPTMSRRASLVMLASLLIALTAGCEAIDKLKQASGAGDSDKTEDEGPTILTGSKKGNYYKAASELNTVLGKKLKLNVKTNSGSFENLKEIGQNKADYAIVQLAPSSCS